MGRIQEGGVLTQKVSVTLGIVALLMMGAFVCCAFVSEDSDADDTVVTINVEPSSDFCGTSKTVTYHLSGDGAYEYEADLLNSSGESSGSVTYKSNKLDAYGGTYTKDITVTAPSTAGDYTFTVKFYQDSAHEVLLAEKKAPLKVVEPITLKYTLKNEGETDITFTPYFVINGEKVDDSITGDITVPANGTKDVTYDYYTKDVSDTRYYLDTDNQMVNNVITGLGAENEKTFYAHDNDYTAITAIVVSVLIVLLIVFFFIYRKPVINKGKPKGRR